jgi:putative Holliday junction resolvase
MRVIAFDVGLRRTGVAVSDASGVLARPLRVLEGADATAVDVAVRLVSDAALEEDRVGAIVVGLPRRLDGSDTHLTPRARAFAEALAARTGLPVVLQDERLSSVEADARLAVGERSWRARKARLDAASAAVILQDYLDARAGAVPMLGAPDDREGVK